MSSADIYEDYFNKFTELDAASAALNAAVANVLRPIDPLIGDTRTNALTEFARSQKCVNDKLYECVVAMHNYVTAEIDEVKKQRAVNTQQLPAQQANAQQLPAQQANVQQLPAQQANVQQLPAASTSLDQ
jgi:hypothetical protein